MLGPQNRERIGRAAQAPTAAGEGPAARDDGGPDPCRGEGGTGALPPGVRRQVPQGRRKARQGLGGAHRLLTTSPLERWRQLRTTNPIASAFSRPSSSARVTKGAGSKTAALAMACRGPRGAATPRPRRARAGIGLAQHAQLGLRRVEPPLWPLKLRVRDPRRRSGPASRFAALRGWRHRSSPSSHRVLRSRPRDSLVPWRGRRGRGSQ